MKVKKGTKKLIAFLLTLALVLTGIGAFTGLEGVFCIKAKAAELSHSVTAGTVYTIGTHNYVAAETGSGEILFIYKRPTPSGFDFTFTFENINNNYEQSVVENDLITAGLDTKVILTQWVYYNSSSGEETFQAPYGVPTKGQVQAAISGLSGVTGWTSTRANSTNAYWLNNGALANTGMTEHKPCLTAFKIDLSKEVYISSDKKIEYAVPVDEEHFPDEIFRNYILNDCSYADSSGTVYPGSDGILTQTEILSITYMRIPGGGYLDFNTNTMSPCISDLTGIEYFTALTDLDCSHQALTSLDVSHNTALRKLCCRENQLTSLDVSHNTSLGYFDCLNNQLTSLDVSNNTALTDLTCNGNQLTSLDVSNNTALTDLLCSDNPLTSLDVSNNIKLRQVYLRDTLVEYLKANFGDDAVIVTVSNGGHGNFNYLQGHMHYDSNGSWLLISRPTTTNPAYTFKEWQITGEGTTQEAVIEGTKFVIGDKDATITAVWKYDPAADPNSIVINSTNFPDENFRNFLLSQTYGADGILTPEEIASITSMDCSSQNIADLTGIEHFTALTSLVYSLNPLSTCDLSSLTALEELVCTGVQYTSLKMPFDNGAITATVTGGGHGKFTMGSYDANEKSFMLSPPDADDTGYIFKGWSLVGATKAFSYSGSKFIVGDNHATITATWEAVPDTYTLTVNEIYLYADGTTEKTETSTTTYDDGEEVTVTKTAPAGYTLYGEASQTFTMDEDKTIAFTYVKDPETYTLTINEVYQDENGDEERTVTSTETYTDGEEATVTKTAPVGYSIVGDASQTVTMNGDKSMTFTYKKNTHILTINEVYQNIDGTEERTEISTETYPYGEEATVTKTAPVGYSIVGDATQTVTMDDNRAITFTYRKNDPAADPNNIVINAAHFPDENFRNFLLSQTYGADGILTPEEIASITSMDCSSQNIADLTGIEHFTALTSLVYSLNPLSTCDLSSLTALEELVCTGVQYTSLKMPFDNGAITATVTGGGHGKFTMGSYNANEKSFMLSSPDTDDTGYIFKGWSATGATKAFSYSGSKFIVGDNHATITATWEAVPDTYTLTVNEVYQDENGDEERTVTSTETYTDGEEATVTKTAPVGYSIIGDASQTVTMNGDKSMTFTYKKNTHTLTINEVYQHIDGTEERTEISTETYPYGEEATVTKTAPADYLIISSASQTVTMDGDKTITFIYRKNDPAADPNNIVINAAHFPDENFRNFLLSQTYGADGILTPEEITSITSMDCSSQNITDLTGIEHFTALTSLVYSLNPLSTCDLSSLTALEELVCTGVQYTSLKMPFDNGAITATVTGGGHGKFTMGSYNANEKSFMLSSPDTDDTGYIFKGWSATGATKAFSYSGSKFIVGDNHATITATWEAVPDTYTLTINEIYLYADGTTEKTETSTSTHEDGEEVTVTKTAPAGYILYGEASQTFTMTEDKTIVFTYVKNASDPDPDPADPIVSDHVFTSSSLLMRWQGLSGERVVKRVGNVTMTGSKQYGRLYGAALIDINATSLPDGKSVSVSIPQKHINLTVGGVTLTATIDFEDVTLVNTDGGRQYVVTVITDRSDLPYEDFFGKTIIGDIGYSVEFS